MACFQPQFISDLSTETSPHRGTQPSPSETGPDPEGSSARGQSSLPVQSLKVHWTERCSHCEQGLHSQRAMEGELTGPLPRKRLTPSQIPGGDHSTRPCRGGKGAVQLTWD